MSAITMKNLLESGVHFGHQTRHWNPKMKSYIYMARNGIHIINLQKTITLSKSAYGAMRDIAAQGKQVLFVGTKKQAQLEVERAAGKCGMPYINKRWLGGLLTNFQTVKQSIQRFRKLENALQTNTIHTFVKTKKEVLCLKREIRRMQKDLSGMREMNEIPSALFVVDSGREAIAVREANRLGIPVFGMVDTNCDPSAITYPIPSNDDAIRAISLFLDIFAAAIMEGKDGSEYNGVQIDDTEPLSEEQGYELSKLDHIEKIENKYGSEEGDEEA